MKKDPKYLRCFLCLYILAYYEAFGSISMFHDSPLLKCSDWLGRIESTFSRHSFGEADNSCRWKVLFPFGLWNTKIVITNPILHMNKCSFCVLEL